MFFHLYRATQTYSWYDITCEEVDPDTGEYYPGHGEEVTVTYGYALQPSWFQRNDGGQSSRKDGEFTDTAVERIDALPDGCVSENQPTLSEWCFQCRNGVFGANRWDWLMRPRHYWFPMRLSSGTVLSSGLQRDLDRSYRKLRWALGWRFTTRWRIWEQWS